MRTYCVVAALAVFAVFAMPLPATAVDLTLTIPQAEWDGFIDAFAGHCREVQAEFPSTKKRLAQPDELLACAKAALADHVAAQISIRRAAEAAAAAAGNTPKLSVK
jgi:hypothetical protein